MWLSIQASQCVCTSSGAVHLSSFPVQRAIVTNCGVSSTPRHNLLGHDVEYQPMTYAASVASAAKSPSASEPVLQSAGPIGIYQAFPVLRRVPGCPSNQEGESRAAELRNALAPGANRRPMWLALRSTPPRRSSPLRLFQVDDAVPRLMRVAGLGSLSLTRRGAFGPSGLLMPWNGTARSLGWEGMVCVMR